jgi:hypothetical protein
MADRTERLTIDEAVDRIGHEHGIRLSPEVLVDICESGWDLCRLDGGGDWSIDAARIAGEETAHDLMERVARLASERQVAADVMDDPPTGAAAGQDI